MTEPAPNDTAPSSKALRVGRDLWPRVLSGIVLAGVALGLTLAGVLPFTAMVAAVCLVLAWEWGRVVRGVDFDIIMAAHVGAVAAAILLVSMGYAGLALLAIAIGMILVALLSFGRHSVLSALGVAFAGLPGVALVWLRSDALLGAWAVLFVMAMVVVTDTAAYFCGRLIGGPKLWPAVSPNKTWAGLVGAIVAAAIAGSVYAGFFPGARPGHLAIAGAVLAIAAQAGDLAESALKRKFGAKDASSLIPGHGGFMDRVDGLVAAAVVATLLAAILDPTAPARALLMW
jgi:phosphatidate cytidylyltransferase